MNSLYYGFHNGQCVCASEMKAILQVPGVPREPDPVTIAEHFTFQNQFSDHTFFQGIKLLQPGHWLLCKADSKLTISQYWRFQPGESDRRDEVSIASELRTRFESAVKRQLISEVPVGAFLSGGMDTGSISAVAVRSIPKMHTFTCWFALPPEADSLEQHFDESALSFELATFLRTQHHQIILDNSH